MTVDYSHLLTYHIKSTIFNDCYKIQKRQLNWLCQITRATTLNTKCWIQKLLSSFWFLEFRNSHWFTCNTQMITISSQLICLIIYFCLGLKLKRLITMSTFNERKNFNKNGLHSRHKLLRQRGKIQEENVGKNIEILIHSFSFFMTNFLFLCSS